ncbi:MAG: pyridoxamine 5'-phosphate oxidase [Bacteriovoracaceae bacterium]|jgi:pyridoxamine 5'-phosphate oxidase|nr:pyridoxamine 5'-phosphate oxidase [Bacteriovoracaceae bacterium]|tara:strand:+ start:156 stop:788 length:633 start_codon:yes stop_codon:yes gene_type:complete
MDLKDIKLEYIREELNLEDLASDPIIQLKSWLKEITELQISYPNAATLCTIDKNGFPSSRIVLTKEVTADTIIFFTDYRSHKALDIEACNKVSVLFFWKELDRQVRIKGKATKASQKTSQEYFKTRPKESQISAMASHQSQKITKESLYTEVQRLKELYETKSLNCPETWGGYHISFEEVEFWQGRPNRLHDRFLYEKIKNQWHIARLSP